MGKQTNSKQPQMTNPQFSNCTHDVTQVLAFYAACIQKTTPRYLWCLPDRIHIQKCEKQAGIGIVVLSKMAED